MTGEAAEFESAISRQDLKECWCCGGLHDSIGTLCPDCTEAGCNRFTDDCSSDHLPVLPDGGRVESEVASSQDMPWECNACYLGFQTWEEFKQHLDQNRDCTRKVIRI